MLKDAVHRAKSFSDSLHLRGNNFGEGGGVFSSQGFGTTGNYKHGEQYRAYTGWVYSIVTLISKRVAALPFHVARKVSESEVRGLISGLQTKDAAFCKDRLWELQKRRPTKSSVPLYLKDQHEYMEIVEDHPAIIMLNFPNSIMTRWALMYSMMVSLELTGKAYLWIDKNKDGTEEIWPVPSNWVTPVHEGENLFSKWRISYPGGIREVSRDDIVYINYPDPANPVEAISPLQSLARSVSTDKHIEESQMRAFSQGIFPGVGIVIGRHPDASANVPGQRPILNSDQRKQITNAIKKAYRGTVNTNEPIILDGLIEDVKKFTSSNTEMDWLNSSALVKERLTQGWGINPIVMGQIEGANRACHDEKTELLTMRGWLRYDKVKINDMAGTMNPTTGRFEWQPVSHVHIYPDYNGEMVRLKGQKMDALITPDHRMWTRRGQRNGILTPDSEYYFKPASELKCHDVLPLSPLPQHARRKNTFVIPGVWCGRGLRKNGSLEDISVSMDAWLEFLGWFVSEGWTLSSQSTIRSHSVGISQCVGNIRECERISAVMTALKIRKVHQFHKAAIAANIRDDGYARQARKTYMIYDKRLWSWLRENCGTYSKNKKLPKFIFDLPAEQAVRTLEAMILGDGSHKVATEEKRYSQLHASYFSTSKELINQAQILSLICGRAARMNKTSEKGVHSLGISEYSTEMSLLPKHISKENYSGTVWCVTVPNGLAITRRNGKPLVSGNSSATADDHVNQNAINPKAELIGQVLTRFLLPRWTDKKDFVFYFERAQSFDPEMRRADFQLLQQSGAQSRNELRYEYDYKPIEQGDSVFMPGFGEVLIQETKRGESKKKNKECIAKSIGQTGIVKTVTRNQRYAERMMARSYRDFLISLGNRYISMFTAHAATTQTITPQEAMQLFEQINPVEEARKEIAPFVKLFAYMGAITEQELFSGERGAKLTCKEKLAWKGSNATDNLKTRLPQQVVDKIDELVPDLVSAGYWDTIFVNLKEKIGKIVSDAIEFAKRTIKEIADQIQQALFGQASAATQAELIACTESTGYLNIGHEVARERLFDLGVVEGKKWVSIIDDATRLEHMQANGQTRAVNEKFVLSNGEACDFPGDVNLSAGQRCNCRCVAISVMKGEI